MTNWYGYHNFVPVRTFAGQVITSRMWAGSFDNNAFLAPFEPGFMTRGER